MIRQLIESFNGQKIIRHSGKGYLLLPLTDHITATEPVILRQAVNAICDAVDWNGINKVVSEEERGGFIAVSVALQRNLPFTLAKQYPIHLPGEVGVKFAMSYNDKMSLYLNGLGHTDKVILVDDIIDTGGTMIAMIKAIRKAGVVIKDVVALAEKTEMGGVARIKQETGLDTKTIIKLDTSGTKSKVVGTIFDSRL
jgi:adenine/guanine phosphoribosyltransferase-like PRPP-binding protein